MSNSNVIPIFLCFDDNFAMHAGVTLTSIYENSKCRDLLDINVLHSGLSQFNIDNLSNLLSVYTDKSINYIDVSKYFNHAQELKKITRAMYYRILIPFICPLVDKAIYLDCDTVLNTCISNLFEQDIGDNYIGAVLSPGGSYDRTVFNPIKNEEEKFSSYLERLGLDSNYVESFYINSGVLLINCNKWRENKLLEKANYILDLGEYLYAPDQDIISVITENRKTILDVDWNFQTTLFNALKQKSLEKWWVRNSSYLKRVSDFRDSQSAPSIVHFVYNKPWVVLDKKSKYDHLYWNYLKLTPWKNFRYEYLIRKLIKSPEILFHYLISEMRSFSRKIKRYIWKKLK